MNSLKGEYYLPRRNAPCGSTGFNPPCEIPQGLLREEAALLFKILQPSAFDLSTWVVMIQI